MFCDFTISIPESILHSILDPPGLPWGSRLAPKMLETCLEIPPGRPKSRSKDLFFGSKRQKRGFQKGTKKGTQNVTPLHWILRNARGPGEDYRRGMKGD